jgi:hypothetical protein
MAYYTPIVGVITNISTMNPQSGCFLNLTVQTEGAPGGIVNLIISGSTYVLNNRQLQVGDRATFFYNTQAPVPLIYPPQYTVVAAAYTPHGLNAAFDVFNSMLTNSDTSLILNMSGRTMLTLSNGQLFNGDLGGKLLLVIYGPTTRSIPAQTTPTQIVVFCTHS